MGDTRTHKKRQLLQYLMNNPDRIITLEELSKALEWADSSVSQAVATLIREFPTQCSRPARGVYRWTSVPVQEPEPEQEEPDEYLVEVLFRQEGRAMVRDTATGRTYVLVPYEIKL